MLVGLHPDEAVSHSCQLRTRQLACAATGASPAGEGGCAPRCFSFSRFYRGIYSGNSPVLHAGPRTRHPAPRAERLAQPRHRRLQDRRAARGGGALQHDHGGVVSRRARLRQPRLEVGVLRLDRQERPMGRWAGREGGRCVWVGGWYAHLGQHHLRRGVRRVMDALPYSQVRTARHLPPWHDDDETEQRARLCGVKEG